MDLMRTFASHGQRVFIVSPLEKKYHRNTSLIRHGNITLLKVETGNLFQVGMMEKALSQMMLPKQYSAAIRRKLSGEKFDLILYSTPPITLAGTVKALKRESGAKTYLLLKDIFPQNAVDIGILKPWMAKCFFRRKEKQLYRISDYIGCMSPANREYILTHNNLEGQNVEICPNSISPEPEPKQADQPESKQADKPQQTGRTKPEQTGNPESDSDRRKNRKAFCEKQGIPEEAVLFLYGGNLGKPQGIPFIIQCMEAVSCEKWAYFIICGTGTELGILQEYAAKTKPLNLKVIPGLPKQEYEEMAALCDVGMIFLDYRFTIPNFPSRVLSYMEKRLPVLVCTDRATDIGRIAQKNAFGRACLSNDTAGFVRAVRGFREEKARLEMGKNGRNFLEANYTVEQSYGIIMKHFKAEQYREGGNNEHI